MSTSIVGAKDVVTSEKVNRERVKVALLFHLRLYTRNTFNNEPGQEWCINEADNPNVSDIPNDYLLKEINFNVKLPICENKSGFIHSFEYLINNVRNYITGAISNQNYEKLIIKTFLYGIDCGDIISHIYSTEKEGLKKFDNLFYSITRFKHQKIKDSKVEFIGLYDRIIRNNEPLNEVSSNQFPSFEDVKEAAILCQYTYDLQKPIEKSVLDVLQPVWNPLKKIISAKETISDVLPSEIEKRKKEAEQELRDKSFIKQEFDSPEFGWQLVDVDNSEIKDKEFLEFLKTRLQSFRNGFYSKLYVKKILGKNSKYAYCTCGTNFLSLMDWLGTNIPQGAIGLSPQYTMSVQNAQILSRFIGKDNLIFVGHSLGGGLASNNAIVTGCHAITFNAAGLSPLRLAVTGKSNLKDQIRALIPLISKEPEINNIENNRKKGNELVHAYIIENEALNKILGPFGEGALGTKSQIKLSKSESLSSLQRHSLMNFIRSDEDSYDYKDLKELFGVK